MYIGLSFCVWCILKQNRLAFLHLIAKEQAQQRIQKQDKAIDFSKTLRSPDLGLRADFVCYITNNH